MKTIIVSLLFVMAGMSASAGPGLNRSGYTPEYVAPEYVAACPTAPPEQPVPASGGCRAGDVCPVGYEPVEKWCWDGSSCGIQCKNMHLWD